MDRKEVEEIEGLILEREKLEDDLWKINVKIIGMKIEKEKRRLMGIFEGKMEDFMRGLDFIFISKLMVNYNHRGRYAEFYYVLAEERLGMKREILDEIGEMYDEFIGYYDEGVYGEEFEMGLRFKRGIIGEEEMVINRP